MNRSEPAFVMLKDGPTLPLAPMLLALDFEARGLRMTVEGDALVLSPKDRITDADRLQIRRYREHLKAIASYTAPEIG